MTAAPFKDELWADDELPEQLPPEPIIERGVQPIWTKHKAQVVQLYIRHFLMITKHGVYIDGFAGRKNVDLEESWAAELVVNLTPRFLRDFFLCDRDSRQQDRLRELIELQPTGERNRRYHLGCGDFNEWVDEVLGSGIIKEKVATFCLIDQFSTQCWWETVEKLARHKGANARKIELFYFFPTGWIGRALAGFTKDLDQPSRWWGDDSWRELRGQSGQRAAVRMAERFRDELGYRFVKPYPIHSREGAEGRVMFHMIHASDHPEAQKLMRRAYKTVLQPAPSDEQVEMFVTGALGKQPRGG